jgi:hypothetical protein
VLSNLLLFCCAGAGALAPPAVDYAKLDRSIKKEPAYGTGKPAYGLLVFGPEAKLRVWVVKAGDALYIDRNADGDLTAANDRFNRVGDVKDIEIADPDGKTRYVITGVSYIHRPDPEKSFLDVNVDVRGAVAYRQYGGLHLADRPDQASVAHFHGPLTMGPQTVFWKLPDDFALHTGDKPTDLRAWAGTMDAAAHCWVVVHCQSPYYVPSHLHPVADIEFPSKDPGKPPVKRRYLLDDRC